MTARVYTQHERDQLIQNLLDITNNQFTSRMKSITNEEVATWTDGLNQYGGQYISEIISAEPNGQLMFQSIACMCDSTLHEFVRMFGKDPLPA